MWYRCLEIRDPDNQDRQESSKGTMEKPMTDSELVKHLLELVNQVQSIQDKVFDEYGLAYITWLLTLSLFRGLAERGVLTTDEIAHIVQRAEHIESTKNFSDKQRTAALWDLTFKLLDVPREKFSDGEPPDDHLVS